MQTSVVENQKLEGIRVALQREFIQRCQKNSAYSLRAFATYLDIDQSFLSRLLKGQRRVTPKVAAALAPKLELKQNEMAKIFGAGTRSMPGFLTISDDEFEILSQWRHFAIIELAKTDGFNPDPKHIARRLGLHAEEVSDAIERLQRLGFIRVSETGWKILTPNTTWSNAKQSSVARRKFQRELIEKSLSAIDNVAYEQRENASVTVAINKSRLPEFKIKLQQMRKELAEFFQADGEENLDEVYQFTLALFPLSKIEAAESDIEGETK